jgi:hypothetical protein
MKVAHGLYGTDTSEGTCHDCSCGTRAVEKLTRYRMNIETIPTEGSRSTSWQSIASIPLLAERTCFQTVALYGWNLRVTTYYGSALFIQYSVDRQNTFYARGCVQRPQQSPLVKVVGRNVTLTLGGEIWIHGKRMKREDAQSIYKESQNSLLDTDCIQEKTELVRKVNALLLTAGNKHGSAVLDMLRCILYPNNFTAYSELLSVISFGMLLWLNRSKSAVLILFYSYILHSSFVLDKFQNIETVSSIIAIEIKKKEKIRCCIGG